MDRIDDNSGQTNQYHELIVNNVEKVVPLMTQMEQWSILSYVLNYVQHSRFHSMKHTLDIKAVNKYKHKTSAEGDKEFREIDFGITPQNYMKNTWMYMREFNQKIVSATRFDENSDLKTTYLGRADTESKTKLRAEESFPISQHRYTLGKLLDGTKWQLCWILVQPIMHVKVILHVL